MAEQLENTTFTTSINNNPDGWIAIDNSTDDIVAESGAVGIYRSGILEQTVNNIDISTQAILSFIMLDVHVGINEPFILRAEIIDDNGQVTNSWDISGSFVEFSQTFTPPSKNFTIRFTNQSTSNEDFPVFIMQPSLDATNSDIPCFAKGTLIETQHGLKPVEELQVGDLIATLDNGLQEIRWIGSRELSQHTLNELPNLAPIRIKQNALGKGYPNSDLWVSPQHRILVKSKIAERITGKKEVLVPAIKLVDIDGIDKVINCGGVQYYHILFNKHQIVSSNGAYSESLYTGPQALKSVGKEGYLEIITLFPELTDPEYIPTSARFIPKGKEMKMIAKQHQKNEKPLFS